MTQLNGTVSVEQGKFMLSYLRVNKRGTLSVKEFLPVSARRAKCCSIKKHDSPDCDCTAVWKHGELTLSTII